AGRVHLLLVPQTNTDAITQGMGIDPDRLSLNPQLTAQVLEYLDERRLLGVEVLCEEPEYVGVNVQTKVALDTQYNNPTAEQEILSQLQVALYRFLNPLTGGSDGTGWPFGRPVYPSDIIKLLQAFPAVRYLDTVQLFELRKVNSNWVRSLPQSPVIDPGPLGLICSWRNSYLRSGHVISLI
ncbi:MAG: putative baseplate assembly protein, partial [Phormidium sp.]